MIGIQLDKQDFEYDVHSLVKAFYPKEEVKIYYEGEEKKEEFPFLIEVHYEEDQVRIRLNKAGQCIFDDTIALDYVDRKISKNKVKLLLYCGLQLESGQSLPWGNLTGIRPTKIAMGLLEKGYTNVQAANFMRENYLVSNQKTALAIAIANRERHILRDIDYDRGYSLYVGIPFCPSICLYCSFSSFPLHVWKDRVDQYLDALIKELEFISRIMSDRVLDTIYIGGGTPTTLEPHQLRRLLDCLQKEFDLTTVKEYTVEAGRPDSITAEKLAVLREYPVTRISVNPQTMNQKTLDIIGRKHTAEDTVHAFHLAREAGFDNINMDLIAGLPGEDAQMVSHTLDAVRELSPDSLTVHSLAVKRAARLRMFREEYEEMTFENNQEIMDLAYGCAQDLQMSPYYLYRQKNMAGNLENVGYARTGKEGIYNILIMEEKQPIIAAGAGASTKLVFANGSRIERVENVKDVTNYITRIDEMIERKRIGIAAYLK
ncbi:MAG: coproporphyrinogen dehydrogenase HemZ [Lachnospiraceae bacterium]|jgi:coproporphyrinogen dehydrogenase HemZ